MKPKQKENHLRKKILLREYGSIDIYHQIQEPTSLKEMQVKQLSSEKYHLFRLSLHLDQYLQLQNNPK
jgi:hypothetical protein